MTRRRKRPRPAPTRDSDALGERAAGGDSRVKGVAAGSSRQQSEANRLASGVGAIEFLDGLGGVAVGFIGHEGGALGAAGAVVLHVNFYERADAREETLVGW